MGLVRDGLELDPHLRLQPMQRFRPRETDRRSGPDHGCDRNVPSTSTMAGSAQWRSSSRTSGSDVRARGPRARSRAASSASRGSRGSVAFRALSSNSNSNDNPRATRGSTSSPVATRSASASNSADGWTERGVAERDAGGERCDGGRERETGPPASRTRSISGDHQRVRMPAW